ncbi:DUF4230 domain-containing protein [Flavivirga algicola]|uniref:DUF4230 domain-containing protein n=1 Tax=Flavivirga algicola TaxID=2729136 RepID=A0ABX1S0N5_9FLAO|nr:DUF4230 domain-containing protein [Flavivirga algicola]NMH87994.1 DUF4230 domain-containing protein [Flavivirga algicola]
MKRVLFGIILALVAISIYNSKVNGNEKSVLKESSMLLQQELRKVSKLIVTEGDFVEVYKYSNSRELFGSSFLKSEKKALVVANAKVAISYNLKEINYELDDKRKTLFIHYIPEPEININPNLEYQDVSPGLLNAFTEKDYNTIQDNITKSLLEKVKASQLILNAKNRLISELARFYVLTNEMEWTLVYNSKEINKPEDFEFEIHKNKNLDNGI